jgi:uncharacterized metal-binding protein
MSQSCRTTNDNVMLLACSGGSNVGQLSNRAAVELTREGFGKMFCLAGIGGHLEGLVKAAREAGAVIAIDGCSLGCARAVLDHQRVPVTTHVVLTELGIEKNKDLTLPEAEVHQVTDAVREAHSGTACSR